ncbi:hypothetical protein C8J57DRAFT_1706060 [Mycena rebaudengoi]|nr:hypothetical protein C8J57DRAFT_1706060 [Mycena rebaudengoi]
MRLRLCAAQWVKFGVIRGRRGPTWDSLPLGYQLIIIATVIADYVRLRLIPALFQLVVRIKANAKPMHTPDGGADKFISSNTVLRIFALLRLG